MTPSTKKGISACTIACPNVSRHQAGKRDTKGLLSRTDSRFKEEACEYVSHLEVGNLAIHITHLARRVCGAVVADDKSIAVRVECVRIQRSGALSVATQLQANTHGHSDAQDATNAVKDIAEGENAVAFEVPM